MRPSLWRLFLSGSHGTSCFPVTLSPCWTTTKFTLVCEYLCHIGSQKLYPTLHTQSHKCHIQAWITSLDLLAMLLLTSQEAVGLCYKDTGNSGNLWSTCPLGLWRLSTKLLSSQLADTLCCCVVLSCLWGQTSKSVKIFQSIVYPPSPFPPPKLQASKSAKVILNL